jgi:amino acid transporter
MPGIRSASPCFFGGVSIATWSAYAFETAVCYMSEFWNPPRYAAGHYCFRDDLHYRLLAEPVVFQGLFGTQKMVDPAIGDGSGMALALASMVNAGRVITKLIVVLLFFSLIMAIITAMAGSSRALNQGGLDGWLPRYLGCLNTHGSPTKAMWTDFAFNLILLSLSNYLFVLAVSNCNYLIFNFLNLNAGWIHRIDNPDVKRPWRCPTWFLGCGAAARVRQRLPVGRRRQCLGAGHLIVRLR